jgi:hypothetical protein
MKANGESYSNWLQFSCILISIRKLFGKGLLVLGVCSIAAFLVQARPSLQYDDPFHKYEVCGIYEEGSGPDDVKELMWPSLNIVTRIHSQTEWKWPKVIQVITRSIL